MLTRDSTAATGGLGGPSFPCNYLDTGWRHKKEVGCRYDAYSTLWWHLPIPARGMVEEHEQVRSGASVVTAARAHAPFNKAERLGAFGDLEGCLRFWRC